MNNALNNNDQPECTFLLKCPFHVIRALRNAQQIINIPFLLEQQNTKKTIPTMLSLHWLGM